MNVLLTCAGRRNYLVQWFRDALGDAGCVHAADASPDAPALQEADVAHLVPVVSHPDYAETIATVCSTHDIGLVVPLNDLELPVLARERGRFQDAGVRVAVSSPEVIDTCFDKVATVRFLQGLGLAAPRTFLSVDAARRAVEANEVALPLIMKPRWGTASIGIELITDIGDLDCAYALLRRRLERTIISAASHADPLQAILIQERLDGDEYGLDVVNDLDGAFAGCFARRKISMRGGETDRAVTANVPALARLGAELGRGLGHIGCLDCDVFMTSQGPVVLEMNARFGGGYPFCHVAGADLPAALVAWSSGRAADPAWFQVEPDVMGGKADRVVVRRRAQNHAVD